MAASLAIMAICCFSCVKKPQIELSKTAISFSSAGGTSAVVVEADCDWNVDYKGDHEWYTLSRMSGTNQGVILVTVEEQHSHFERSAYFTVTSSNGKVSKSVQVIQQPIAIVDIHNKVWFLHEYERWATDYADVYIDDSYKHWNYYIDESFDNWFFYFMADSTGYQLHTKNGDTTAFAYSYIYYPLGDSLYINFVTDSTEVEDYHATILELNQQNFVFFDEFLPHQFEKLYMANISTRSPFTVSPNKIKKRKGGPLIPIEE